MNEFVSLEIDFGMTGIPYRRLDEGSHSWVNLVDHPEHIELLPEPKREPVLKECLIELNGTGSNLTTIGCESWESSQSFGDFENHRYGAYVATHFREESLGDDAEDCFVVFFHLAQTLSGLETPEPGSVNVLVTLKQFGYLDSSRQGWQMELTTVCTWNNPESAKALWSFWFPTAVRCLMDSSRALEQLQTAIGQGPSAPKQMACPDMFANQKSASGAE